MGFLKKAMGGLFGGKKSIFNPLGSSGGMLNPANHLNPKNHFNLRNHLDPAGLFGGQGGQTPQSPLARMANTAFQQVGQRREFGPWQQPEQMPWQPPQIPPQAQWGGRLGSLYQQQMEDYGMRGSSYGPRFIP